MKKNRVIEFEPRERLLEKAKNYVESLELFTEESDQAIPLLLRAMKHADPDLKREIMLLLGTFAKEACVWPLYDVMTDASDEEEVRHDAAIQLSVIGPLIDEDSRIRELALKRLAKEAGESVLESWRPEIEALLNDSDMDVKRTALKILSTRRV